MSAWLGLASLFLVSCAEPKAEQDSLPGAGLDTSDAACELLIETINTTGGYREEHFNPESRIAGCARGESEEFPSLVVMRLDAVYRQDLCGSVLMGWFAADVATGRVWEWDVGEWQPGEEIIPSPRT